MAKNQAELVLESTDYKPEFVTTRVKIPGIETLHNRTRQEIAEVLANVMKTQQDITEIKYVLGKYIEITHRNLF